jgi:uncharacterized membrane protein YbaN (DUF454 family)
VSILAAAARPAKRSRPAPVDRRCLRLHNGRMRSPLEWMRRALWVVAGLVCVALGTIGVIVPGLPSTVFFIGAAACFSRSSPRLERWVLGLPGVGPAVRNYRAGLGMPRVAKRVAIACIVVFTSFSVFVVDPLAARIGIALFGAVGVWYVGWRVPTAPADGPSDDDDARTVAAAEALRRRGDERWVG